MGCCGFPALVCGSIIWMGSRGDLPCTDGDGRELDPSRVSVHPMRLIDQTWGSHSKTLEGNTSRRQPMI